MTDKRIVSSSDFGVIAKAQDGPIWQYAESDISERVRAWLPANDDIRARFGVAVRPLEAVAIDNASLRNKRRLYLGNPERGYDRRKAYALLMMPTEVIETNNVDAVMSGVFDAIDMLGALVRSEAPNDAEVVRVGSVGMLQRLNRDFLFVDDMTHAMCMRLGCYYVATPAGELLVLDDEARS